jgi:NRPS condensation-like uncharacterized protein
VRNTISFIKTKEDNMRTFSIADAIEHQTKHAIATYGNNTDLELRAAITIGKWKLQILSEEFQANKHNCMFDRKDWRGRWMEIASAVGHMRIALNHRSIN